MAATTIDPRTSFHLGALLRVVLAAVIAAALIAAAFLGGRASAPVHTVRSIVTVPAAAGHPYLCRSGRPC